MKLTPSHAAERIAVQYLRHEFRKLLVGVRAPAVWRAVDRELLRFPKVHGESSFWNLVAAIAEGWKLKHVYRILSDNRFAWRRRRVPLRAVVLTGMSPAVDRFTVARCRRDPLRFQELWERDVRVRRAILKTGFAAHQGRNRFPVLLWRAPDGLRVFDGMRRVLFALTKRRRFIDAWVGEVRNPKGRPLMSGGFVFALSQAYAHAGRRGKNLERALLTLGAVIARDYRNGREVMEGRIAAWSRDPELSSLFRRMGRGK